MRERNKTRSLLGLAALSAFFSAVSLWACSVPVFRYALEHWRADPYQAILFHRGPLSASEQSQVRELSKDGMAGRLHANVSLRMVDLDRDPEPDALEFWGQLGADATPWLVLRYPLADRLPGNVWSGPLTDPTIPQLLDSPLRMDIARRLAHGQSAVWVLLEIGDPEKDTAAMELIESRLAYLATVLKVPKLEPEDIVNGLVSVGAEDLRVEFSLLRLSRKNPAEQVFVKMLLGTESDLGEVKEPIAFPIFGRGRALYALVGKGINLETIDTAASFLVGSCSCQVKDLNPGVDLLFASDWDAALKTPASAARDLSAQTKPALAAPATVTISGGEDPGSSSTLPGTSRYGALPRWSIVSGFALVLLIAAGILVLRKK